MVRLSRKLPCLSLNENQDSDKINFDMNIHTIWAFASSAVMVPGWLLNAEHDNNQTCEAKQTNASIRNFLLHSKLRKCVRMFDDILDVVNLPIHELNIRNSLFSAVFNSYFWCGFWFRFVAIFNGLDYRLLLTLAYIRSDWHFHIKSQAQGKFFRHFFTQLSHRSYYLSDFMFYWSAHCSTT